MSEPTWTVSGDAAAALCIVGATGFLGQAVVREAARQGLSARLLMRSPISAEPGNAVRLEQAFTGCDTVINCAGLAHVAQADGNDQAVQKMHEANCVLAERLAVAARESGVSRFVHVSTVAALKSQSDDGELVGNTAHPDPVNAYGKSKLLGDQRVMSLASDTFRPIVLRPPAIFGPGAKGWFPAFLRAAKAGVPLPLGNVENRRSFVFAGNIANAIVHAANRTETGAWIVTDSAPISTKQFYALALKAAGRRRMIFGAPQAIVRSIAKLALGARADSLLGHAAFDGSDFVAQTHWAPPWTLEQGMRYTMAGGNDAAAEERLDA